MLQTLDKAKATSRAHADRLLALQTRAIRTAFRGYVANATSPTFMRHIEPHLARGDVDGVLRLIELHTGAFANQLAGVFVDTASAEMAALSRKLVRKAPVVSLTFNVAEPRAVRLMQANRLAYVRNLTRAQQASVRAALVRATQEGLGTTETSRLLRAAIGLSEAQQRELERYSRVLTPTEHARALDPEAEHLPPSAVARMVNARVEQGIAARAERIGRTESLRIVGQAREEALLQSLEATGTNPQFVGQEWNATMDSRTRDRHAARDGQRRRLGEPFDGGIMRPGDGPAEESVNCRCVLTTEIFDSEQELQAWIAGGS